MTTNEQKSKNWSPFNHSLLLLLLLLMLLLMLMLLLLMLLLLLLMLMLLLLMCGNQVVSVFGDTGSVRVTFVQRTFDNIDYLLLYHKIIQVLSIANIKHL